MAVPKILHNAHIMFFVFQEWKVCELQKITFLHATLDYSCHLKYVFYYESIRTVLVTGYTGSILAALTP